MKTPSILILLTVFVTYVVGYESLKSEKAVQNQDQEAKLDREALLIEEVSEEIVLIPHKIWVDPVRLNMVQFITNSGCYFYEHGPWFPYLDEYITTELRLQLSNWCAKYTNIVY